MSSTNRFQQGDAERRSSAQASIAATDSAANNEAGAAAAAEAKKQKQVAARAREAKLLADRQAKNREYELQLEKEEAAKEAARAKAEKEAAEKAARDAEAAAAKAKADAAAAAAAAKKKAADEKRAKEAALQEKKRKEQERVRKQRAAEEEADRVARMVAVKTEFERVCADAKAVGVKVKSLGKESIWQEDLASIVTYSAQLAKEVEKKKQTMAAQADFERKRSVRMKEAAERKAKQDEAAAATRAEDEREEAEAKKKQAAAGPAFGARASVRGRTETSSEAKAESEGSSPKPAAKGLSAFGGAGGKWKSALSKVTAKIAETAPPKPKVPDMATVVGQSMDMISAWRDAFDKFEDDFGLVPAAKLSNLLRELSKSLHSGNIRNRVPTATQQAKMMESAAVTETFDFSDFGAMMDHFEQLIHEEEIAVQEKLERELEESRQRKEEEAAKRAAFEEVLKSRSAATFQTGKQFQVANATVKPDQSLRKKKAQKRALLDSLLTEDSSAAALNEWIPGKSKLRAQSGDMHDACKEGDLDRLLELIHNGEKVMGRHGANSMPMHWAAWSGQTKCAKVLLNNGSALNVRNKFGYSPLHWAAMRGNVEILKWMLKENADVQISDQAGSTPLHWAVRGNQAATMKILIDAGAQLDAKTVKGEAPLHWAATEGEGGLVGCIDILIHAGCDYSLENSYPRPKAMDERAYAKMMQHQGTRSQTALLLAQEQQKAKAVTKLMSIEANPPVSERERSEQARTAEQKRKKAAEKGLKKAEKRETELKATNEAFQANMKKAFEKARAKAQARESPLDEEKRAEQELAAFKKQELARIK